MSQERNPGPVGCPGQKRAYQPPKVSKVPINVDEVVLAGCKTSGGGGGGAITCIQGCVIDGS
jgi:hypothetical protein